MCPQCRRPGFNPWVGKICWRRGRLLTPVFSGFPCGSAGKESTCNAGDLDLILGLERSPGEGKGYPLQYSGLENSMDCIVLGVTKSQTRLSNFHFHFFSLYSWASKVVQSKEFTCNVGGARDAGLIPGLGKYPREEKGYPLQYSGLENSMDCIAHGAAKSQTRLSNFHFHFFG